VGIRRLDLHARRRLLPVDGSSSPGASTKVTVRNILSAKTLGDIETGAFAVSFFRETLSPKGPGGTGRSEMTVSTRPVSRYPAL